jgi:hypothetical protein
MHELLGAKQPELEFGTLVRLNRRTTPEVKVLGHPGYAALRELLLGRRSRTCSSPTI